MVQVKFHINEKGQFRKCVANKRACRFNQHVLDNDSGFSDTGQLSDLNAILLYVQSKGILTEGMSPLEAIKQQLRVENNDRKHKLVDNAEKVEYREINIDNIRVNNLAHLNKVNPKPAISKNSISVPVAGIVYQNRTGEYTLIDGYHRHKFLSKKEEKNYQYIVLSN